jgi:hypothetical protein
VNDAENGESAEGAVHAEDHSHAARTAIEWLIDTVLQALSRDEPITPSASLLLLRRYIETGRESLRDALGVMLAQAMDRANAADERGRRSEWLAVFSEAAAVSEDQRLGEACEALIVDLRSEWPAAGAPVEPAMRSIEACLASAVSVVANPDEANDLICAAIDELERVAGRTYAPGAGVGGTLGDHASLASALITAYHVTDRLPYGMLAEELMQFARHTWWDNNRGTWNPTPTAEQAALSTRHPAPSAEHPAPSTIFVTNCEVARVLCRLASLHQDADYRRAAILADCDYAADTERTLAFLLPQYRDHGAAAAIYGVAAQEWLAVREAHHKP